MFLANVCHHRREWSAAEFPSECMALLGGLFQMTDGLKNLLGSTEYTTPAKPTAIGEERRLSILVFNLDPVVDEVFSLLAVRNSPDVRDLHLLLLPVELHRIVFHDKSPGIAHCKHVHVAPPILFRQIPNRSECSYCHLILLT